MATAAVELHRALNGNTEFLEQVCGVLFNAARDIEANPAETAAQFRADEYCSLLESLKDRLLSRPCLRDRSQP